MRLAHIGFLAATGAVLLGSSADLFAQSRVVGKPQARLNGGPRTRKPTNIHASPTPEGSLANPRVTLPFASLTAATTNIAFQTTRQISTGLSPVNNGPTAPYLSSLGDFDGNGTADVASFVQDSDNSFWLSILLSNGDGTFQSPVLTGVVFDGSGLMAAADLNADGKCDVVFVGPNSVDVLIGNGDGTFQPAVNYATQISNPAAVALVDTNNDTLIDIIIANGFVPIPLHINGPIAHGVPDANATNPVATLLGTGGGLFAEPVIAHYNGTMNYGVFADIDGDGRLDLVSSSQVFLGTPTDYQPPITLTASSSTCWAANGAVAVADMNGDGLPDIITADCLNQAIIVFPNLGAGSFGSGLSTPAGNHPATMSLADINGDGKIDVVVADLYSMDIRILLGNQDGTLQLAPVAYPVGGDVWTVPLVADFNGDSHLDVLVPSAIIDHWASLIYLGGNGDGSFIAAKDYFYSVAATGSVTHSFGLATADLNGDGLPDFIVGAQSDDLSLGVAVFLSNSSSTFDPGVNYGSGGDMEYVALADVDGDGNPDIIASSLQGSLRVFLGNGNGTFQTTAVSIAVTSSASLGQLVTGMFDANPRPDVAVLDNAGNVWILLNNSSAGAVSFASPASYALTSPGWAIAAADFGNGHVDLAVTQGQSSCVSILLGNGTGTFTPQADFDLGSSIPRGLAIAQLNPSGHADMVVAVDDPTAGMGIAVADGNGDGTFNSATLYPATAGASVAPLPAAVRIADIDGDGNLDVAFTNSGEGTVGVLYGTGHWGTGESPFYAPIEYAANESPANLVLADVNGDGALDAVVGGFNYLGLTALFNTGGDQVTLSSDSGAQEVRGPERASLVARAHAAPGDFTFAATVVPVNLAGAGPRGFPSGTVTFSDGDIVIGTGTLSGGATSVTSNISTAGTHVITAQYSGDSNNAGLTRGIFIQAVDPSAASYMLSASTNSATLEPGQSATFVVTVSPDPTSTDVVNLACGNLPQGVSCSFAPSSVTLNGSTPVSTTLTVSAAPGLRTVASSRAPDRKGGLPLQGLTFGAFGCVVLACFRRQTLKKFAVIPLLIILTVVLTLVGCGGNIAAPTQSSSPVATTIHVTATSAQKKASARLDFQITIRP